MKTALTVWLAAFCLSLGMVMGAAAPVTGYRASDGSHFGLYVGPIGIEHDTDGGPFHVDIWACIDGHYDRWGCPA